MKKFSPLFVLYLAFLLPLTLSQICAQSASNVLDSMLSRTLDSMHIVLGNKSLSAAIEMPYGKRWAHAVGVSSVNPTVNVTPDDAYLIGSVTKTFTAACILQLVDEQRLTLNDSLSKWLPNIPYINPNITIKQLLRHQSGLYDALNNPQCQPALLANLDSIWSPEVLVKTFIQAPLAQPGGTWSYCNTNYFLLSMVIKKVTENDFFTEYRNRFFTPLGLNTIVIPSFEALNSPVAHAWMDLNGDGVSEDAHDFYSSYLSLNSAAGAAGGYYATPKDMSIWMRTYMRGDLLSAATVAEAKMTVAAPGSPGATYGLGLLKKAFAGFIGYGHGGDLVYSASSWYFPLKDISISVLNNDVKVISWDLAPVVAELLRTYNAWLKVTATQDLVKKELYFVVFPTPFSDVLNVNFRTNKGAQKAKLVLNNAVGMQIFSQEYTIQPEANELLRIENLENIPCGIYFLSLYLDGGTVAKTTKLVK